MKHLKRFFIIAALLYTLLLATMYLLQRDLLYPAHGDYFPPLAFTLDDVTEHVITAPDGIRVMHWYSPAKAGKPTLIYFHGNAENVTRLTPYLQAAREQGLGVFLMIYRGYPGSEGQPTELNFYVDAARAIEYANTALNIPLGEIVLFGRSMGSGVAVEMATRYPVKHTVLISPYTSTVDVAQDVHVYLPVKTLMKDRFESLKKIKHIKSPLWIFHGDADQLIPIKQGKALHDAAIVSKRFTILKHAGHNNINMSRIMRDIREQFAP